MLHCGHLRRSYGDKDIRQTLGRELYVCPPVSHPVIRSCELIGVLVADAMAAERLLRMGCRKLEIFVARLNEQVFLLGIGSSDANSMLLLGRRNTLVDRAWEGTDAEASSSR